MSVKITNLTKTYGDQVVLDNISFEVGESEILGFLGPNGAGKTTTMKIITGSLFPDSGEVNVSGFNVFTDVEEVKKRVGYLAEHNPLYSEMYVKEFLLFIAGVYGVKDKAGKVREMIKLTGLTKEQNKKIKQLSKGYKQRVGLAQVLLNDPEVLILDEPTTGLDPNQLKEIRALIKETGKNKTVIFSTHIMQEVQALCDRVIILNNGKIVADDRIDRLDDYVASNVKSVFVQFDEKFDISVLERLKTIDAIEMKNGIVKVDGKDDYLMRKEIFKFAKDNDYTILSMFKEDIDVENIFSKLTHK